MNVRWQIVWQGSCLTNNNSSIIPRRSATAVVALVLTLTASCCCRREREDYVKVPVGSTLVINSAAVASVTVASYILVFIYWPMPFASPEFPYLEAITVVAFLLSINFLLIQYVVSVLFSPTTSTSKLDHSKTWSRRKENP